MSVEILESLQSLLQRFDQLDGRLDDWATHSISNSGTHLHGGQDIVGFHQQDAVGSLQSQTAQEQPSGELQEDFLHLQRTLDEAWRSNEELRHQNETLAAQLAQSNVNHTVQASNGCDDSLSWENRKQLILRQMENDSFDADEFVNSLSTSTRQSAAPADQPSDQEPASPQEFVASLVQRIESAEETIRNRDNELQELRMLLENQPETRDTGTVIGASAIASMIDADALVVEERERLQQLKNDWEDKFRQAEIEASLERAKLSRERQELAKRSQELEEQLEEVQREKQEQSGSTKTGRRWLTELGLNQDLR